MRFIRFFIFFIISLWAWGGVAQAATCAPATSGGTASSSWPTYCWIDFSSYVDATAAGSSGQNFTINLTDGSTLSFNLKTSTATATGLVATAAPSWTGSAVGNTAFIGIPNKPILYTTAGGTVTMVFSNILIAPPSGAPSASAYAFVVADAESTNNGEALTYTTNGGNWVVLDQVPPISGNIYPTTSGAGTSTYTETGAAGTVGGYIVQSITPSVVTVVQQAGGLQGVMIAVRFASVVLNKTLIGPRANAADQFTYSTIVTSSSAVLNSATTSGSGSGSYTPEGVSLASGIPFTIKEAMAAGSVSAMTSYSPSLTCTNATSGSPTSLPSNQAVTTYSFPSLAFGDSISCMFTNTPYPILSLSKAIGASGRSFDTDQFVMNIKNSSNAVVATTTTSGTGATVTNGTTTPLKVTAGQNYTFSEAASGTTLLSSYASSMVCVNAFTTSSTVLPNAVGGTVQPILGDNIVCTITNTSKTTTATLQIQKTSLIISDPINGTTNPRAIPGAVVQYSIKVSNIGKGPVDVGTVSVVDPLPTQMSLQVSGSPIVTLTDGATPSGLASGATIPAAITYTKAVGGNSAFTYTPVNTGGYDTLVTGIKVVPTGTMAAATVLGAIPYFTVSFYTQVK